MILHALPRGRMRGVLSGTCQVTYEYEYQLGNLECRRIAGDLERQIKRERRGGGRRFSHLPFFRVSNDVAVDLFLQVVVSVFLTASRTFPITGERRFHDSYVCIYVHSVEIHAPTELNSTVVYNALFSGKLAYCVFK